MLRCRVESLAHPSVVVLSALFRGTLPGFLLGRQRTERTGAQGDSSVFGVSPCPRPFAAVVDHQIHVSEVYPRNLINAIHFHLDRLDFVL